MAPVLLPSLAVAALLVATPADKRTGSPPAAGRFEGFITFEEVPAGAGSPGPQPVGGRQLVLKVAVSPRGVRVDSFVKAGARRSSGTVLVTGNPPVALEWSDDDHAYVPLTQPPAKGAVKGELLGRDRDGDVDIARVRLEEGGATSEVWTAPGLVDDLQARQLAASTGFISAGAGAELKRLGAWGAVLRVIRGGRVLRGQQMQRGTPAPELFMPSSPPAR